MTQLARRAEIDLKYNGINASEHISKFLISLTYTDAIDRLDDLQLTLQDRDQLWQGSWHPAEGDVLLASFKTLNWVEPGETQQFNCGTFEVDAFDFSGPPDIVAIKSTSLPAGSKARREKRSQAWEKVKLRTVANDIAIRAGLKLLYELADNPLYERLEQDRESDLSFLFSLAQREGAAVKVANGFLVLFDEAAYERKSSILTIKRADVVSHSFAWSTSDSAYSACKLSFFHPKSKKNISVTYRPPGAPKNGPLLEINESVESEAEALRTAKNRLRQQNKNHGKGSLTLPGDVRLIAGVTIDVSGWRSFDGKYIVERATHALSNSGYVTNIDIRKVLGW